MQCGACTPPVESNTIDTTDGHINGNMAYGRFFSAVDNSQPYVDSCAVQYVRLGEKCGLLTVTFHMNASSSSNYNILSISKFGTALGLSFKNPTSTRRTGTWWYNDGDSHGDRYEYSTACLLGSDGYVQLGRIYSLTSNAVGAWAQSSIGNDRCLTVSGIYLEEN